MLTQTIDLICIVKRSDAAVKVKYRHPPNLRDIRRRVSVIIISRGSSDDAKKVGTMIIESSHSNIRKPQEKKNPFKFNSIIDCKRKTKKYRLNL